MGVALPWVRGVGLDWMLPPLMRVEYMEVVGVVPGRQTLQPLVLVQESAGSRLAWSLEAILRLEKTA